MQYGGREYSKGGRDYDSVYYNFWRNRRGADAREARGGGRPPPSIYKFLCIKNNSELCNSPDGRLLRPLYIFF